MELEPTELRYLSIFDSGPILTFPDYGLFSKTEL
jgi:hypothetical protein